MLRPMDEVRIIRYDHESIHREILQLKHVKNIGFVLLKGVVTDEEFAGDENRELKYGVKSVAKLFHRRRGFGGM